MSHEGLFALYRGDEFVDVGTKKELAARHGMKPQSIYFMSTPSYRSRAKLPDSKRLLAYRIEEEEEDDGR